MEYIQHGSRVGAHTSPKYFGRPGKDKKLPNIGRKRFVHVLNNMKANVHQYRYLNTHKKFRTTDKIITEIKNYV